jgi:ABC-type transport system involved in multi-copper enzyme maturation permease subunit
VWSKAFREGLPQLATLFAVLLGAGFLSRSRGALYTLSLPVSRQRLLAVRFVLGLAQLGALVLLPVLLIPLLSPAVGAAYGAATALAHGVCLFFAVSVFFSLALFLSTVLEDRWGPLLAALGIAIGLALVDSLLRAPGWSLYAVMSGESFFRSGRLPWAGLAASAVASTALYYGALAKLAHRDF